ncbi:ornithine carbamoyltransferase subunit F, partial [Klebsiella aerogenes]
MSALYQKHFLRLLDFTAAEITGLVDLAASTRTRCSFEV